MRKPPSPPPTFLKPSHLVSSSISVSEQSQAPWVTFITPSTSSTARSPGRLAVQSTQPPPSGAVQVVWKNDCPPRRLLFSPFIRPPCTLASSSTPIEWAIIAPAPAFIPSPEASWQRATAKAGFCLIVTSMARDNPRSDRFLCRLLQRLHDDLRRLGAGEGEAPVDEEEGHAVDADPAGGLDLGGARFAVDVGGDGGGPLEAHVGGERGQHLGVVEPQAFLVLGLEEALDHRVAAGLPLRRLDQRVRLGGVGDLALVEVVVEARRRGHPGQPRLRLGELLGRVAALPGQVLLGRLAGAGLAEARRVRLQLERAPGDRDVIAVPFLQRLLDVPLAEVAPGAGDVRPDIYVHAPNARERPPSAGRAPRLARRDNRRHVHQGLLERQRG